MILESLMVRFFVWWILSIACLELAYQVRDLRGSRVLTATEMRVVCLVAAGKEDHEVASGIGTTVSVVKNMLRRIFDKIGVWNRTELALWYASRVGSGLPG